MMREVICMLKAMHEGRRDVREWWVELADRHTRSLCASLKEHTDECGVRFYEGWNPCRLVREVVPAVVCTRSPDHVYLSSDC